jgi:transcriptional regulator with XRE-family HTH domain
VSIGDKVRATRKAAGISQEEVARRAGVSLNVINRLERGVILDPHYSTLRGIASALGVPVEDLVREPALAGKAEAPREAGRLEEERRAQEDFQRDLGRFEGLWGWKSYLTRRVEWCERVLQKSQEERFLNPFLSLDTAIQWAIYVGIESAQLRDAVRTEVRSYTDADSEIVGELHALLDRFVAVEDTTDVRVRTMMDEAGLTDEDKEQRLRLIHSSAA